MNSDKGCLRGRNWKDCRIAFQGEIIYNLAMKKEGLEHFTDSKEKGNEIL